MKRNNLYLLLVIAIVIAQCKSLELALPEMKSKTPMISYEGSIRPIMNNFCIGCHGGANPAAGFALESYAEVKKAAMERPLIDRINDGQKPMPMGGLMHKEYRSAIKLWKEGGYKKTGDNEN